MAYSNNKKCSYLPGGKVDNIETSRQALCREIEEELNVQLAETELEYYTHITAPAYGETTGIIMEQDCFFVSREISALPSAEIGALKYFSLGEYLGENKQAPGAIMILEKLQTEGYID